MIFKQNQLHGTFKEGEIIAVSEDVDFYAGSAHRSVIRRSSRYDFFVYRHMVWERECFLGETILRLPIGFFTSEMIAQIGRLKLRLNKNESHRIVLTGTPDNLETETVTYRPAQR